MITKVSQILELCHPIKLEFELKTFESRNFLTFDGISRDLDEHPNICAVRAAINWEGAYAIMLDYAAGGNLLDTLLRLRSGEEQLVSFLLLAYGHQTIRHFLETRSHS